MIGLLQVHLVLLFISIWLRCVCSAYDVLPTLSPLLQNAIRSQRDLMSDITVDQLPLVGVNLTSALFNAQSQNDSQALLAFESLLQNGVQTFTLDLEQNTDTWMIPETTIAFSDFLSTFQYYINETDDNLSANLLFLMLRTNLRNNTVKKPTDISFYNNSLISENITYLLDENLGRQRIYTPDDLQYDRTAGLTVNISNETNTSWPKLEPFLYTNKKRVVIADLTDELWSEVPYIFNSSILYYDQGNKTLNSPNTTEAYQNLKKITWRFLDTQFTPSEIRRYMGYGYSPIISNPFSIENITNISSLLNPSVIWSWGPNQPLIAQTDKETQKKELTANNCAIMEYTAYNGSSYWIVDNCYSQYVGICRNSTYEYEWLITDTKKTYFEFDSNSDSKCPDNYSFGLPRTPLEESSLLMHLEESNVQSQNIWIDLNSIAVSNCWVTGGPYATCPYQKSVSRRNFVEMLTPATVCSFVILVMVSYLNLLRIPIHNNRKSWKRIVNEVSKSEIEGVPS